MGLLVHRHLLLLKPKVKSLAVGLVAVLRTCECLPLFTVGNFCMWQSCLCQPGSFVHKQQQLLCLGFLKLQLLTGSTDLLCHSVSNFVEVSASSAVLGINSGFCLNVCTSLLHRLLPGEFLLLSFALGRW